jgi:CheY-like chemotaxis protein
MILAVVEDLIFLSKIQETAKHFGLEVNAVSPDDLGESATRTGVTAVIVDLNHRSGRALEAARGLKSRPSTRHVRAVGFLSHVQGELAAAAREAGCDLVLARSAFTQQLPTLLHDLSELRAAAPPLGSSGEN